MRASPGAKANAVTGIWRGAGGEMRLSVRVTAPPDKGKANAAIVKLLAKSLGIPKSDLRVAAGETSRQKTVEISRSDDALITALEKLAGDLDDDHN
ncbi:DUF167 domain-containing protein [Hyphococcus sp. DH-69]|uniref:DUF167 domain-containing protein n=1 Tax=Hyphococcus formosus TaxID=3143534 RepID=UPI00398BBAB6